MFSLSRPEDDVPPARHGAVVDEEVEVHSNQNISSNDNITHLQVQAAESHRTTSQISKKAQKLIRRHTCIDHWAVSPSILAGAKVSHHFMLPQVAPEAQNPSSNPRAIRLCAHLQRIHHDHAILSTPEVNAVKPINQGQRFQHAFAVRSVSEDLRRPCRAPCPWTSPSSPSSCVRSSSR